MKNKITNSVVIVFMLIFGIVMGYLLYVFISANGIYPSGSETMYHVFRGDLFYRALGSGSGMPLYDRMWYNGIEPMRFIPFMSPLLYALCELASGCDVFRAYIFYCILIYLLGLFSFSYIGFKRNRPGLGFAMGIMWFFLPTNIYVLFVEGDLAKSLALAILPILFFSVYQYLDNGRTKEIIVFCLVLLVTILSSLDFAIMVTIAVVAFLVVYRLYQRKRRRILKIISFIPASFLMAGLFLVPYLKGRMAADDGELFYNYFQNLSVTLNPFYNIRFPEAVYFGLALFVVAILGTLVSNREASPGFLNAIITVVLTSTFAGPIIRIVPGSENLTMLEYLPVAALLVFLSLICWKKLKRWVLVVFSIAIILDSASGLYWVFGKEDYTEPKVRLEPSYEETFIKEAQEICMQRVAVFDLSTLGADGAFMLSSFGDGSMGVFGSGWAYSATFDNTKRLNSAMCDEYFDYMFDRCIELGADTVIIQKDQAVYGEKTLVKLDKAAERLGYDIIDENGAYMLYHLDVPGYYGTVAKYDAIGIGYSAYSLSLAFPNIKETGDYYVDHYNYDYLSQFKTVYLSGFFCENREKAEELVLRLSQNGVRVVILADGIPEDRETRSKTFLGVTCNVVQFENGYPILYTEDFGEMDCDLFPLGYAKWVTYYLNGLGDVKGTISDNDVELAFYGTGANENICYIGLNIPFYYYLTLDDNAEKLMQWVMGMDPGNLPERKIYPLDVKYSDDSITITSDVPGINTTLAYHDNFRSDSRLYVDNNLLVVDDGVTRISFAYPRFKEGLIVTLFGIFVFAALLSYMFYAEKRDKKTAQENADTEENSSEESDQAKSGDEGDIKEKSEESDTEKTSETPVINEAEEGADSLENKDRTETDPKEAEDEGKKEKKEEIEKKEEYKEEQTKEQKEEKTEEQTKEHKEDQSEKQTEEQKEEKKEGKTEETKEKKKENDSKDAVEINENMEETESRKKPLLNSLKESEAETSKKKEAEKQDRNNINGFDLPYIKGDDFDI